MEFYKLYYILHRRTDFVELYRIERQLAYPEWYDGKERLASEREKNNRAMRTFCAMQAISMSLNSHSYI